MYPYTRAAGREVLGEGCDAQTVRRTEEGAMTKTAMAMLMLLLLMASSLAPERQRLVVTTLQLGQRGGILGEVIRFAKELGDEGRAIGCFERRSGWRVLEPPSLQEWVCWLQMR
jgi:hypothetical protein